MSEQEKAASTAAQTVEDSSLLDQIMQETNMNSGDEAYDVASKGVQAFIGELLKSGGKSERVRKQLVDEMIVELDKKISNQVDEIIHNESFQKMESAWRGLKFVVDRTDFKQNIQLEIFNVSKDDLSMDFENASDITESGLYKKCYTAEYGQHGGRPYGAIIANYNFDHSSPDISLLQKVGSVSTMAHATVYCSGFS